jgi:hypothetical protein
MRNEEMLETITRKRKEYKKQLQLLYAAFNKTELSVASEREIEISDEIEQAKEYLQMLQDRQEVICSSEHHKFCPCCGLKLPRDYLKKLKEDMNKQNEKVKLLECEYEEIAKQREYHSGDPVGKEIDRLEQAMTELIKLEQEARNVGII